MTTRPDTLEGSTRRIKTVCGMLYCTINHYEGKIHECFLRMGKSGTCAQSMMEMLGRLISIAVRKDTDIKKIIKSLKGIRCHSANGDYQSCADGVCIALEGFLNEKEKTTEGKEERTT
jgi:ribonucleoside-diphosphate reductase alpha chain